MTAFVKKIILTMTVFAALLQCGAAFAAPYDFNPEDILAKRAESRFDQAMGDVNAEFDPYAYSMVGFTIGIDPGHQFTADTAQEQVYPDNEKITKDRMSPGAVGVRSGTEEYDINLEVSLKLESLLRAAGAEVIMTRSTNDVNISNIERAAMMNREDVDFWVRIHCNSSRCQRTNGALIIAPGSDMEIHDRSEALGKQVLTEFCAATGAACKGVSYTSTQTGFNWSYSPVVTIEMGYLSNPNEDGLLSRDSYQSSCAEGIFCGIAAFCAEESEG